MNRWNPESRAGAIAISPRRGVDVKATERIAQTINGWAQYQNLEGESDSVETSPVQGTYDWRAYLHEETRAASERERASRPAKKEAPKSAPAPSVFYA